jgi:hypothetical protein
MRLIREEEEPGIKRKIPFEADTQEVSLESGIPSTFPSLSLIPEDLSHNCESVKRNERSKDIQKTSDHLVSGFQI